MKRTIHKLTQGSADWHAYRAKHFNASDCPAMLGISPYKSRDALLKEMATGIVPEVDEITQRKFDEGHAFEAAYRKNAAKIMGEDDLFPVTISLEIDGLNLSASLDGINFEDTAIWEHKTLNKSIEDIKLEGAEIPLIYRAQMEMQLLVSGARRCLLSASKWTTEKVTDADGNSFLVAVDLIDSVDGYYIPNNDLRDQIIAGWKQFAIDLANYSAPEAEAAKAIAEPVETLPAITYKTEHKSNGLELRSNIEAYKAAAKRLVEQSKKKLETDQDFANAESRIKSCKEAEEKIATIQSNVIGEVADIDKFVKDLGAISEMLRQCRLNETKQVSARKDEIKAKAIREAQESFAAHLDFICKGLSEYGVTLPIIHVDFAGAIKGLKTISSINSKLNDAIAQGKIDAKAMENKIRGNLELLNHVAEGYMHLFYDKQNLVVNTSEYVVAVAKQRIAEFEEKEQARIQAEAQRIASEQIEKDRAQAEKQKEADKVAQAPVQESLIPSEQVDPMKTIIHPDVYDEYVQIAPQPLISDAFSGDTTLPQPLIGRATIATSSIKLDQIDPATIKLKTLEYVLKLFEECEKNKELDFRGEIIQMINATKLPRKVA